MNGPVFIIGESKNQGFIPDQGQSDVSVLSSGTILIFHHQFHEDNPPV